MVIWGSSIVSSFARNFFKPGVKITFFLCELFLNAALTDISAVVWSPVDRSSLLVYIFEQTKETFFFKKNMDYSVSPYRQRAEINFYSQPFDLIHFPCAVL